MSASQAAALRWHAAQARARTLQIRAAAATETTRVLRDVLSARRAQLLEQVWRNCYSRVLLNELRRQL